MDSGATCDNEMLLAVSLIRFGILAKVKQRVKPNCEIHSQIIFMSLNDMIVNMYLLRWLGKTFIY